MAGLSGEQAVIDVVAVSERLCPSTSNETAERLEPPPVVPTEIEAACPLGHLNAPGMRFCGACGLPVGAAILARGEPGFELHPDLAPLVRAPVVVKRYCSAFQETELADRLAALGARHLTICGMQTEFCVDTTCRAAFERGFTVTLAADAHTTFDGAIPAPEIIRHHNATLGSGFVRVVAASEI